MVVGEEVSTHPPQIPPLCQSAFVLPRKLQHCSSPPPYGEQIGLHIQIRCQFNSTAISCDCQQIGVFAASAAAACLTRFSSHHPTPPPSPASHQAFSPVSRLSTIGRNSSLSDSPLVETINSFKFDVIAPPPDDEHGLPIHLGRSSCVRDYRIFAIRVALPSVRIPFIIMEAGQCA